MNRTIKIVLILAIATITGCYYDNEERLYPKLSDPCSDTVVTYSSTVTQILHPCLSCHSGSAGDGGGVILDNYNAVITYVNNGKLMGSINHTSTFPMPKGGGKLPVCEIDKLQEWIQTPNN